MDANKNKRQQSSRNNGVEEKKRKKKKDESPPSALVATFKILDSAVCFLMKKSIPCRIRTVCQMVETLCRRRLVSLDTLRKFCFIMPEVLCLTYEADTSNDSISIRSVQVEAPFTYRIGTILYHLHLSFKDKFKGTGKAAIARRLGAIQKTQSNASLDPIPLCPLPRNPLTAEEPSTFPSPLPPPAEVTPPSSSSSSSSSPLLPKSAKTLRESCPDLDDVLRYLKDCPFYDDQLTHVKEFPPVEMVFGEISQPLHPTLRQVLRDKFNVSQFFRHQAVAIDAVAEGKDVIVSTSTSSGKSLIFNVPVFQRIITSTTSSSAGFIGTNASSPRALYIFPTKALAQDQLGSASLLSQEVHNRLGLNISIGTYDGDTSQCDREDIRKNSHVIITNPDMLHVSILPNHAHWGEFLQSLEFVIIDEAHMYYGAFGSHVACVLKRLLRVVSMYQSGPGPQFITCSATIGNPLKLFHTLVSPSRSNVLLVGEDLDGSSCGKRVFGVWNPPVREVEQKSTTEYKHEKRKSSIYETALLLSALVRLGVKTLAFCRTRKLTELVLRYTHQELKNGYNGKVYQDQLQLEFKSKRPHLAPLVAGYRGGYQVEERRRIESQLFSGQLLAVTATCALELGIDVGSLDAVILLGYLGSAASLWQQVGRAGRSGKDALALFVCFNGPVDQYFVQYPEKLLDRTRVEDAVLDPLNKYILKDHLSCALKERPLAVGSVGDLECFGGREKVNQEKVLLAMKEMERDGILVTSTTSNGVTWYQTHPKLAKPYNNVSLRIIDPVSFELYNGTKLMDTIPYSRAFFELYPGGIYMHQGESYLVSSLDLTSYKAYANKTNANYYTAPRDTTDIHVLARFETKPFGGKNVLVHCGAVEVATDVWGYRKIAFKSGKTFEMHEFTLPSLQFETQATWIDLSTEIQSNVKEAGLNLQAGIHGLNHLLQKLLPLFVTCHSQNIGTEHVGEYMKRPKPARVMLFDNCPGGIGASRSGFNFMYRLMKLGMELISNCECENGCPKCIVHLGCPEHNSVLNKAAALIILNGLLGEKEEMSKQTKLLSTPTKIRNENVEKALGMGRARVEQMTIAQPWALQQPNHSEGMK